MPIEVLAKNNYDELGQLIKKSVGGTDVSGALSLQKVNYKYNIRGWLKSINDISNLNVDQTADLFAFKINYNNVDFPLPGVEALYNGNISETHWITAGDNQSRNYGYEYDALNRLLQANYQKGSYAANNYIDSHSYDEALTYDKNGNILTLFRTGFMDSNTSGMTYPIDVLTYTYKPNSNQLQLVYDETMSNDGFKDGNSSGEDYVYDGFGNMLQDLNKKIVAIKYNHLNLPVKIEFNGEGENRISYLYNAVGVKLGKNVISTTPQTGTVEAQTDYLNGFQYLTSPLAEGGLQFFPTAEGYVSVVDGNKFNYVYNYTDHLGNIRVSYSLDQADQQLKILEENHYYPFGLKHSNYNEDRVQFEHDDVGIYAVLRPVEKGKYQYKYNGKEFQDELGLNVYDYGSRNYMPDLGRWANIDPKAELLEISSPYVYALNCPIIYLDADGELPILINGRTPADSERASSSYWGVEIINTIKGSGIANPGGQFHYVDGNQGLTADDNLNTDSYKAAMSASNRTRMGSFQAESDWGDILSKLEKDPKTGKIIEKIQIYTHSRGGAFGEGYTEKLLELIKANSSKFADASNVVDFVFDMAPHQSGSLNAVNGVPTYTMDHEGDILSDNDKGGVNGAFTSGEAAKGLGGSHKIASFAKDLKEFTKAFSSSTTTQGVINAFIKNMKDNYGIKVTVK